MSPDLSSKRFEESKEISSPTISKLADPVEVNEYIGTTVIAARTLGPAKALSPIARILSEKQVQVVLYSTDLATQEFSKAFPDQTTEANLPVSCDFVIISADDPQTFEIDLLKKLKATSSFNLVVVEDSPGSITGMLNSIETAGFKPNLILTLAKTQEAIYKERYPESVVVTIGQPSFDSLLHEDIAENRMNARKKLSIEDNAVVVTLMGIPSGDYPHVTNEPVLLPDLNSVTLEPTVKAIKAIASNHPDKIFYFFYKPHPREKDDLWLHPSLDVQNNPANLKIVAMSKQDWNRSGFTTKDIWLSSDLAISTHSTVNQEVALAASTLENEEQGPIPMHILISKYTDGVIHSDRQLLLKLGAAAFANTVEGVDVEIDRALFDPNYQQQIRRAQQTSLVQEYRFKSDSTPRAYKWIRAYAKYGGERLSGLIKSMSQSPS